MMKMEDFKKLADSELELVSGGMTVDYTLNAYCPDARLYFFEAKNGWFDSYGNVLVKKG
jgi:hypothetical protein